MLLCSLLGIVVVYQVVTVKPEGSDYADFVGDGLPTPTSSKTLDQLKREHIASTQRGYPILVAGAVYFLALALLRALVLARTVQLIWVLGLGVIFPAGVLLGRLLGIHVISRGNPLGTLGGLIAATQVFYLPVFHRGVSVPAILAPADHRVVGGCPLLAVRVAVQQPWLPVRRSRHRAFCIDSWRTVHGVLADACSPCHCTDVRSRRPMDPAREP